MKKILYLITISFLSTSVNAQQALRYKIKFLPNHIYNASMKTNMEMKMTDVHITGSKSHVTNTNRLTTTNMEMIGKFDINTGSTRPDKNFPVTIIYKSMDVKSKVNNVPVKAVKNPLEGQIIYGHSDEKGNYQLDAVAGGVKNEQVKAAMKMMVNKIQGEVQFPDRPLRIGETFTQQVPMNLPIAGTAINVLAKMTYKLKAVKANLAYFDNTMDMNFNMNSSETGTPMKMTGKGGGIGSLIYNINENYYKSMTSNLNMAYNMVIGTKGNISTKMKMTSQIDNVIRKK